MSSVEEIVQAEHCPIVNLKRFWQLNPFEVV
jgi:hypothetical protein